MLQRNALFAVLAISLLTDLSLAVPRLEGVRIHEAAGEHLKVTARTASASNQRDHSLEEHQQRSGNETVLSGPGSTCHQDTDCATALVCLVSETCSCPEQAPVLLRNQELYVCTMPRGLNEPCLGDSVCSHNNPHARCLDSICRCPAHFYASGDSSLCLPESGTWEPLRTVMFPAVLLIVAFAILGVFGYKRLNTSTDENPAALVKDISPTTQDSSGCRFRSFCKWMKMPRISRPNSRRNTEQQSQQDCFLPEFWQYELEKIASRKSFHSGNVGASARLAHASRCATLNATNNQSPFQKPSANLDSHEFISPLSDRRALYGNSPARVIGNILKSRALTFTLLKSAPTSQSTHQQKQFTIATCSQSAGANVSIPPFFLGSTITNLCYGDQQEIANNRPSFQEREVEREESVNKIDGQSYEHCFGKCKSETALTPNIKRLRRALSENPSQTPTVTKKRVIGASKNYRSPVAPIQRCTATYSDDTENTIGRGIASKARTQGKKRWFRVNFLRKRLHRGISSCNTSATCDGTSRDKTEAATRKEDSMTKENCKPTSIPSRWPPRAVGMDWRRLPTAHGAGSTAPDSTIALLSTSAAQDKTTTSRASSSCNSAGYFNPGFLGDSPENAVCDADSCDKRLSTSLRFHSGSPAPDSVLDVAMLRAERRVKGSSF